MKLVRDKFHYRLTTFGEISLKISVIRFVPMLRNIAKISFGYFRKASGTPLTLRGWKKYRKIFNPVLFNVNVLNPPQADFLLNLFCGVSSRIDLTGEEFRPENKENRSQQTQPRPEIIRTDFFLHIKNGKRDKNR
jgi:hypothetical protein